MIKLIFLSILIYKILVINYNYFIPFYEKQKSSLFHYALNYKNYYSIYISDLYYFKKRSFFTK